MAGLQKQARIAVVGAGWWACEYHIPHVRQNRRAELVSACRLGAAELERVRRQFDLPHVTENHLEVYDRRPDGVIVASPHVCHFEHAAEALRRGCHVLVEKPMATRTADARELARLAGESGRTLMTPYGLNHTPYMEQAADWVRAGRVGAVRHVALHMSSALLDLFGGEPMLETSEHFYRPPPSTWADPLRAGGYGWGQLSHALAALFFVTDLAPESVHAAVHRSRTGVDDHDAAVLRFEGGAIGTLSGAAGLPKHAAPQLDLRIYGADGMLVLDVEDGRERLSIQRHDGSGDERRMERGEGSVPTPPARRWTASSRSAAAGRPATAATTRSVFGPCRPWKPSTRPRTPERRWRADERTNPGGTGRRGRRAAASDGADTADASRSIAGAQGARRAPDYGAHIHDSTAVKPASSCRITLR